MYSVVASIVFGIWGWIGSPIIIPVIGLAFGMNALLKESRLPVRNPRRKWAALIGVLLSGSAVALLLIQQYRS
jgi:hypothetical protein